MSKLVPDEEAFQASYEECFGITPKQIVPLDHLLELGLAGADTRKTFSENPNVTEKERDMSDAIFSLCANSGFTPMLVELSLLPDKRFSSHLLDTFASFIWGHPDTSLEILKAYVKAINAMGSGGSEQIVPHIEAYSTYPYFFSRIDESNEKVRAPAESKKEGRRKFSRPLHVSFQEVDKPKTTIQVLLTSLTRLLMDFTEKETRGKPDTAKEVIQRLNSASLLVIPLYRTNRRLSIFNESKNGGNGTYSGSFGSRAGLIFFLLTSNEQDRDAESRRLQELVRKVSWYFTQSALLEASSAAERYQLTAETIGHALEAFSGLTHSVSRLFRKYYVNVPADLFEMNNPICDSAANAWLRIEAAVRLAYLFAMAVGPAQEYAKPKLKGGFVDPLVDLYKEKKLPGVLLRVAKDVFASEALDERIDIEWPIDIHQSEEVSDEDFALAYLLAAEPISNLRHLLPDKKRAKWHIVDRPDKFVIVLEHQPKYAQLPVSTAFINLGEILRSLGIGDTMVYFDRATNLVFWYVYLKLEQ